MYIKHNEEISEEIFTNVLQDIALKPHGISTATPKEELFKKIKSLSSDLEQVRNPRIARRNEIIKEVVDYFGFRSQQQKLLLHLKKNFQRGISRRELIEKIGTRDSKSENLRSLVYRVNQKLAKISKDKKTYMRIDPLRGKPFNGYKLVLETNLSGLKLV